ncbi:MAG TPA: AI-2E family transporter [Methanotrichaceae archaeon]|nr:AI-2E family transporter [Methanotrichaceae archaeon]
MNVSRKFSLIAGSIVVLVAAYTIYLTKDFISTAILSVFLAYLLRPLYKALYRRTGRKSLSSFLSILLIFIAVLYILLSVMGVLAGEITSIYHSSRLAGLEESSFSGSFIDGIENSVEAYISQAHLYLPPYLAKYIPLSAGPLLDRVGDLIKSGLDMVLPYIVNATSVLIADMPIHFAQFLVAIFITYYLLIDGRSFVVQAVALLPEKEIVCQFFKDLHAIYNTLFSVYFVTSLISGAMAVVVFFFLGISYPLLWGAIIALFTMIPMVGPTAIYVPFSIYFLLIQDYTRAAILLIFGTVFLVIVPENVLRPRLAQKSASIHPIITLLAYTAPVFVIGLMGVILGPALYGFLLACYRTIVRLRAPKGADAVTGVPEAVEVKPSAPL